MTDRTLAIKGLHHSAYRCRDSARTRAFYEDFLGLPLACAFAIDRTKTGRATEALHTFYRLGDGSYLAFFEVPDMPFEWKAQHDFDLHIALEVEPSMLDAMLAKARGAGMEARGVSDHGFIDSIYLRDPDGYVVELTAKRPGHDAAMAQAASAARAVLDDWSAKRGAARAGVASITR